MKVLKSIIIILFFAAFISCDDNDKTQMNSELYVAPKDIKGFAATVPMDTSIKNKMLNIAFTKAIYGVNLQTTYELQIDSEGNSFKKARIFRTINADTFKFSIGQLNEFLQDNLEIPANSQCALEARVVSYLATTLNKYDTLKSDKVSFKCTPYIDILWGANTLYMYGTGTSKTPQNNKLEMIPVHSEGGKYWKIVWLNATGTFKFCSSPSFLNSFGKSGNATGTINDNLEYDKGDEGIPVPGEAGYYMVVFNSNTNKVSITKPAIYLMGPTIGGWTTQNPVAIFTVDNAKEVIKFANLPNGGELRIYASHPYFSTGDWWHSEFIILNNLIAFRGTGGDQTRAQAQAGQTVELNFKTGVGTIK